MSPRPTSPLAVSACFKKGFAIFTTPGLTSNRELNLAHKVLLDPTEAEDREAAHAVSWLSDTKPSERLSRRNRQLLKSEVGARAPSSTWNDGTNAVGR